MSPLTGSVRDFLQGEYVRIDFFDDIDDSERVDPAVTPDRSMNVVGR
jgi:hypothetical protein